MYSENSEKYFPILVILCKIYGTIKLLLMPKGNDSNYRFLSLKFCVLQVNLLFSMSTAGLDQASCGVFSRVGGGVKLQ